MNTNLWNVWIKYRQVTTDSRKAVKGQIFVALKGERFNGNDFALQALEQDAEAVVVDEDIPGAAKNDKLIRVDDSLKALQDLAREWRKTFSIPVIGISGSNGKTTTKELLRSVLSTTFKVHSTKGNLNNHIGVPLTLLDLEESHQISIVEMGANKPKDIQEVASFALPTAGLMTNVGFTHLDGMGSLDGVEETEGELFAFLRAHGGKGFVNEEDFRVVRQAQALLYPLTFGGPHSDFQILTQKDTESGMHLKISSKYWKNEIAFSSVMTGRHNALNILAAVSVATHFGVSAESLVAGVRDYVPSNNRSQWVEKPGKRIMLDAYNANPSSM